MTRLHDQITTHLDDLNVGRAFRAIHSGEILPLLTDYFVRRIPDEWNAGPPPEMVGGRTLIPLFVGCDSYAIYCADIESFEILQIDPENLWPPTEKYENWDAYVRGLFGMMTVNTSDAFKTELRVLLQLDES